MEDYGNSPDGQSLIVDVCLIDSFDKLMLGIELSLRARDAMRMTIYTIEAEMEGDPTEDDYIVLKQAERIFSDLSYNVNALKEYLSLALQVEKIAKEVKSS